MIGDETLANMSDEEREELAQIYSDPVLFARVVLDETPRWYQESMIRDTSAKKVYRTGRRVGKCIHKDTLIYNPVTGENKTVESIHRHHTSRKKHKPLHVGSLTEQNTIDTQESIVFDNGIQDCYRVKTESGREIIVTGNHPLLCKEGWIETDDIKKGMKIGVPSTLPSLSDKEMPIDEITILALMAGDGVATFQNISFYGNQIGRNALSSAFNSIHIESNHDGDTLKIDYEAKAFLEKHKIMWTPKENLRVPTDIYSLSLGQIKHFLRYFFSCHGTYTEGKLLKPKTKKIKRAEILQYSFSKPLLKDIQHLLLRFGIPSSICPTEVQSQNMYCLSIQSESYVQLFAETIGIFGKESSLRKLVKKKSYERPPIIWETVESKSYVGKHQTYDVSVPVNHNFIANDIFVHNTWSMAIEALHFVCANAGKKVLIAAPYESQVELIFKEIRRFIKKSSLVSSMVVRDVRSPHRIEFSNDGEIMGYTSGTKSGSNGDSMRGLDAHLIILDEVDRMNQGDIDSIMAIRYTDASSRFVRAASTPTGRRAFFWQWCLPPGTQISLPNGNAKNVEDIETGDKVIGAYGDIEDVSQTFVRQVEEDIVEIDAHHVPLPLKLTKNHEVLTDKGWKLAEEITKDDYIKVPYQKHTFGKTQVKIELTDLEKRRLDIATQSGSRKSIANEFSCGYRTISSLRTKYKNKGKLGLLDLRKQKAIKKAQDFIADAPQNKDFYYLAGLYLAEGHIMIDRNLGYNSGIALTFSDGEQSLVDKTKEIIETHFGLEVKVRDRSNVDSTFSVEVYSNWLGIAFQALFGEKENKKVPPELSDIRFYDDLLQGILDGDGSTNNRGMQTLGISAKTVINQLFNLSLSAGQDASICFTDREDKRNIWTLGILKENYTHKFVDDSYYVKVKSVSQIHYTGPVYNFETSKTHTYVASFLAVHNCTDPAKGWSEHHYPSTVNPAWDHVNKDTGQTLEEELREELSEQGWTFEVLAEFGVETQGVFDKADIDRARKKYSYYDITKHDVIPKNVLRIIGVDWDEKYVITKNYICGDGYELQKQRRYAEAI